MTFARKPLWCDAIGEPIRFDQPPHQLYSDALLAVTFDFERWLHDFCERTASSELDVRNACDVLREQNAHLAPRDIATLLEDTVT